MFVLGLGFLFARSISFHSCGRQPVKGPSVIPNLLVFTSWYNSPLNVTGPCDLPPINRTQQK